MAKWIAVLCGPVVLVALISACGGEESEQISCITSLDCPGALICQDGWCVEDTGEVPDDGNGGYDPDMVDEDNDPGYDSVDTADPEIESDGSDETTDTVTDDDGTPTEGEDTPDDADAATDEVADTVTDETADIGTDTGADTVVDEDVVTDAAPDVDTPAGGETGAACSATELCTGSNVCAEVFTNQDQAYCYLNCAAPNDTICNGTAWPQCTVVGSYALCLAAATIVGNFTAKVDSFQTGNNVSLTIGGTTNIQAACSAYQNTANDWVLQCSKILQTTPTKIQLDAVFFWPQAAHAVGTVAGAEGQVYETTYDAGGTEIDNWMRAFFLTDDGSLTLTTAGTATGATVAGSINFNGNAFDAQFAP